MKAQFIVTVEGGWLENGKPVTQAMAERRARGALRDGFEFLADKVTVKQDRQPAMGSGSLSAVLREIRETLAFANDIENGPITDTIWMKHGGPQTLFDYIDAALDATRPTASGVVDLHADDAAVDKFADAMKARMAQKRVEGRGGWDDSTQCSVEYLQSLLENTPLGKPVDIGNFAMMLFNRAGMGNTPHNLKGGA